MQWYITLTCALAAYAIGSIPFGYLAGRLNGMDIRQHGSGNIGATNVFRVLGARWGVPVFLLDFLKGLIAVLAARGVFPGSEVAALAGAVGVVLGHNYPVWLQFRGGKGIASSAGVLIGLIPLSAIVAIVVWVVVMKITRYVSLASLVAAAVLPVATLAQTLTSDQVGWGVFGFTLLAAAMAFWRHRGNIVRLRDGTEPKMGQKNSEA
ncbi:MAG: glycerol-3-phosphate 1-O-acyltransferase PlsY [Verrucomicrobiales bacterium]